jgi:hypothetical protein
MPGKAQRLPRRRSGLERQPGVGACGQHFQQNRVNLTTWSRAVTATVTLEALSCRGNPERKAKPGRI